MQSAQNKFRISGQIVDVLNKQIFPGTLQVENGKIKKLTQEDSAPNHYILPGFVDAHIHIESSMLPPSEFARVAVIHGTVGTVSDPHEIANVLGMEGVKYMIRDGRQVPFKFNFSAPSCVPATRFESSGARLGADEVEELLDMAEIRYLGEVMNYPDVIAREDETMKKIKAARDRNKPLDGHAPGLRGDGLKKYASAGISTDHECFQKEEALEKLEQGIKILIREGSAARNFDELIPILGDHYENCMFCSDDKHPDELAKGHINQLVRRALDHGHDVMKVLKVACVNPVQHYGLDIGLLQEGDPADFMIVDDLAADHFNVLKTYINGRCVAEEGRSLIERKTSRVINKFNTHSKKPEEFEIKYEGGRLLVIEATEGQLITEKMLYQPKIDDGRVIPDTERDILKLAVVNRYEDTDPAIAFIKNFGLKRGALATSVAHDSHNILAVGTSDEAIARAVNLLIDNKGGVVAISDEDEKILPLPIAGLISDLPYDQVSKRYQVIREFAGTLGCTLQAPFITLSFMALLVIPKLKLSDKGLFDGEAFEFVEMFEKGVNTGIDS